MTHVSTGSYVTGQSLGPGSGAAAVLQSHAEGIAAVTKNLRVSRGENVSDIEKQQQLQAVTQHLQQGHLLKSSLTGAAVQTNDLASPGGLFSTTVDLPVTRGDMNRWERALAADKKLGLPTVVTMEQLTAVAAARPEPSTTPLLHLSPIPVFCPEKHKASSVKDKMAHNKKWRNHRRSMALFNVKDDSLISGFRDNHILSVLGDAGAGKTLQLPQVLVETDLCKKKRVLVVMRSGVAALAVSQRLTEECGPLATVGVATPNHNTVADNTQIVVTTSAVLCRALVADRNLANVGAIIIDEAHDQHTTPCPFTELLLAILKEQLKDSLVQQGGGASSAFPKLVFTVTGDPIGEHTLCQYFREDADKKLGKDKQVNIHRLTIANASGADGDAAPKQGMAPTVLDLEQLIHWSVSVGEEAAAAVLPTEEVVQQAMERNLQQGAQGISATAAFQSLETASFSARHWTKNDSSAKWKSFLTAMVRKLDCSMKLKSESVSSSKVSAPVLLVLLPTSSHVELLAQDLNLGMTRKAVALHEDLTESLLTVSMKSLYPAVLAEQVEQTPLVVVATPGVAYSLVDQSRVVIVLDSTRTTSATFQNALTDSAASSANIDGSSTSSNDDRLEICRMDALKMTRRLAQSTHLGATVVIHLVSRAEMQKAASSQAAQATQVLHPYVQTDAVDELVLVTRALLPATVAKPILWLGSKLRQTFISTSAMTGPAGFGVGANKEHLTKMFHHSEERLIKMGFLDRAAKVPTLFGCASALQCQPLAISRLCVLSAMFEHSSVQEALLVAAAWLVGLPVGKTEVFAAARRYFTTASEGAGSDFDAVVGMWRMYVEVKNTSSELAEFLELLHLDASSDYFARLEATFESLAASRVRLYGNKYAVNPPGCDQPAPSSSGEELEGISAGAESLLALALYPNLATTITVSGTQTTFAFGPRSGKTKGPQQGGASSMVAACNVLTPSAGSVLSGGGPTSHTLMAYTGSGALQDGDKVSAGCGVVGEVGSVVAGPLIVFCGEGNRVDETVEQRAPKKTRGFLPAVTNAWRLTAAARNLPPPTQKEVKPIPAQLVETVQEPRSHLTVDGQATFALNRTAADFVVKLRDQSRRLMNALLQTSDGPVTYASQVREVREALDWIANRERSGQRFHKARRSVDATQKPDAPIRSLQAPYVFTYDTGRPRPTPCGLSGAGPLGGSGVQEISTAVVTQQAAVPSTYHGRDPTPQEKVMITKVISLVQKAGTRSKEKDLLANNAKTGNKLFDFLHPENELYPYYSDKLRQVAPELAWVGDDLGQLEVFLKELEIKVVAEITHDLEIEEKRKQEDKLRLERLQERKKKEEGETQSKSIFGALGRVVSDPVPQQQQQHKFQESAGDDLLNDFVKMTGGPSATLAATQADQAAINAVLGTNNAVSSDVSLGGMFAAPTAVPEPHVQQMHQPVAHSHMPPQQPGVVPTGLMPAPPGLIPAPPGAHMMASGGPVDIAAMEVDAFAMPPPGLPPTVSEHNKPSVLVYPLPPKDRQLIGESMPLPLVLVRALGEKLGIKVGPSLIVGDWARIEVPNSMVMQRCLEMNWFFCLGCKLRIIQNDRIYDNPEQGGGQRFKARFQAIKGSLTTGETGAPARFNDHSRPMARPMFPPRRGEHQPQDDGVDSVSDISE